MSLSLITSNFINNTNTAGSALFIDGEKYFIQTKIFCFQTIFIGNIAYENGGGFYVGSGVAILSASFENLTCSSNTAISKEYLYLIILNRWWMWIFCF